MTNYEMASLAVAVISILISIISIFLAGRASNLNKNMFKRQGVIDLHMAWQGMNEINKDNPITPDVIRAVNALTLTAALWNHDVMEKIILYQSYWPIYQKLYEQLDSIDKPLPGVNRSGKDYLTSEIKKAYTEMNSFDLSRVSQTKL